MLRPCVLALCVLASAGCARSAAARGTGWWRVTTDHVRLTTDVDHDRAVTAGWAFEDLARALSSVFPVCNGASMGEPFEVTMLARESEFTDIAPAHSSGFYQHALSGLIALPGRLVVPAAIGGQSRGYTQIFLHEMTHRFVQACFRRVPLWLNEGMATFFETLRVGEHDVVIGIAPFHIGLSGGTFFSGGIAITPISRARLEPPSQLAHEGSAAFRTGGESAVAVYASAWTLVHMFELGPDAALRQRFLDGLSAMHTRTDSWLHAGNEDLDAPFAAYASSPRFLERRVPYDPQPLADPIAVAMPASEAELVLAALEMGRLLHIDHERVDAYLALARQDASTLARAELMRLQLGELHEGETQGSAVDALVAAHPDDRAALVARAVRVLAGDSDGLRTARSLDALRGRTDLDAHDLAVEAMLAVSQGDWDLALAAATEAHARDPGDERATFVLLSATERLPCPIPRRGEVEVSARAVQPFAPFECVSGGNGLTPEQRQRRRQGLE